MDDVRTDFGAAPRSARRADRPNRLGSALREARLHGGLDLEDLAELTHIRPLDLQALEAGHLDELPGEPHRKNVVRRYAQAVGLEPARALMLYAQDAGARRGAGGGEVWALELPPGSAAFGGVLDNPWLGRTARPLALLLLVGGAVWSGLTLFNRVLVPGSETVQTDPVAAPAPALTADPATAPADATANTTANAMVLLSLRTVPPGAEVSIDGYRFGQSPIVDAPVRAGARTLTVERGGYRTFRRTFDLSESRRLNVTLLPTDAAGNVAATRTAPAWRAAVGAGDVTVTVSAPAWLEVYRGDARGGERLVYETAAPGDRYTFRAPVYIFSGNAGGVSVARGDLPASPLGPSGAVLGAAY